MKRTLLFTLLHTLLATSLFAQIVTSDGVTIEPAKSPSFALPTTIYFTATSLDYSSTAYCLYTKPECYETNPLLNWAEDRPAAMIAMGAAVDVGTYILLRKVVSPEHPKLFRTLLYTLAGLRTSYAIHNFRNARR